MIEIKNLKKSDVGRWVKYTSHGESEYGKIRSWNDTFVFVVYKSVFNGIEEYGGIATPPEKLEFSDPPTC